MCYLSNINRVWKIYVRCINLAYPPQIYTIYAIFIHVLCSFLRKFRKLIFNKTDRKFIRLYIYADFKA